MHHYRLWTAWLESSLAEKDLVDTKLKRASNASLQQKRINSSWGCITRSTATGQGRGSLPLLCTRETHLECLVLSWVPQYKTEMKIMV